MLEDTKFRSLHGDPNLLQLLFDTIPTLVFVKDRQGRFVFANIESPRVAVAAWQAE
ncbi:hypothetical protein GCM10007052_37650 [Halioglobus japonicus]|uniref:hypothetical protein n=1 Tax=Halioglobus japonicus TaxID=930805 RepID=UPI0012F4B37D|nr:hypothetical protein [Halioglobus japonicus]GHD24189.1 hypothetical protein GCM10007052_37650 [Halioglobus japonicus]